jgi:LuxR family transcriptional regulator, maltose regulon positive regulatory protein
MVLDLQRCALPSRDGLIHRTRLTAKLRRHHDVPLLALIAPAGYGKTSLLRECFAGDDDRSGDDDRPSAWLTLGPRHTDPTQLLREVMDTFGAAGALMPAPELLDELHNPDPVFGVLRSGPTDGILPRDSGGVVVLDDFHVLDHHPAALRVMAGIVEHLPPGVQVAVASRTEPQLHLGRMRAHHALCELRTEDLAMDNAEANELLYLSGLELTDSEVESLCACTEGWPAGLYLAALSLQDQDDRAGALERFAGDDHVVLEYLREEYLSALSPAALELLIHSAILPELHGPLCDALLQHSGATPLLGELARGNLLLRPIDRSHEWYRAHSLLRDALLRELRRIDPQGELAIELHRRASAWHADHGDLDCSIQHAVLAGDAQRAGDLIWENLPRYLTHGHNPDVQRWLGHFSSSQIAAEPALAAVAAHSSLASGDIRMAEHWGLAAAGSLARAALPPSVASLPAGVAIIEAAVGRHGVLPMGRDAARAYQLEPQDSPWRSLCCLFLGVSDHLAGDRALAREHLEEGVHRSAPQAPNIEALCLVQLATITAEEGDWQAGAELVDRAVTQVDSHGLGSYPTSALIFAVSAAVRSHIGHVDEGKRDLHRATRLMTMLEDFIPWYEAETRIALARAALQLADIRLARTLLAEASHLARRVPDATVFRAWLDEIWEQVDTAAASALSGSAALTMAELRILRFLPTHLSFREIGLRLHVSTNTVKTQAHAVYRKLGVGTRSQAVTRAGEIGLIDA